MVNIKDYHQFSRRYFYLKWIRLTFNFDTHLDLKRFDGEWIVNSFSETMIYRLIVFSETV